LRIKIVETKSKIAHFPSPPVQRSINKKNLREKQTFETKNYKKNQSFGHHQRDKDEKGLSPQPQQEEE
jgi:hypothetical protein